MALFGRQQRNENDIEETQQQVKSAVQIEPQIAPKQRDKEPTPPPMPVERKPRGEGGFTTIGKGITIKGELVGDEDVKIEGRVLGKIVLERNLIIGQSGVVEADVQAENINIGGKVTGNLVAQNRVEIVASGTMMGDIKAPKVIVAEGAHFKGNVDMDTSRRPGKEGERS